MNIVADAPFVLERQKDGKLHVRLPKGYKEQLDFPGMNDASGLLGLPGATLAPVRANYGENK